jgi:hypothetical protein
MKPVNPAILAVCALAIGLILAHYSSPHESSKEDPVNQAQKLEERMYQRKAECIESCKPFAAVAFGRNGECLCAVNAAYTGE